MVTWCEGREGRGRSEELQDAQKPLEAVPTTLGACAGRQEPGTSGAGGDVCSWKPGSLGPPL